MKALIVLGDEREVVNINVKSEFCEVS